MRLVLLDQAKEDIANIADYITEQSKSKRVGKEFARRIYDKCKELASIKGTIGVERPELRADLRSHPFGNYVIFFMYNDNILEVVTIIEGHRDIQNMFTSPSQSH